MSKRGPVAYFVTKQNFSSKYLTVQRNQSFKERGLFGEFPLFSYLSNGWDPNTTQNKNNVKHAKRRELPVGYYYYYANFSSFTWYELFRSKGESYNLS